MREVDSRGLMAFWTDIDQDYILEFQKWHNCEHVAERVSIPGFHVGRRYRGIGRAPMFFITYETADPSVLQSEAYMQALNNPTPWTREALRHFNNNVRSIYRLIAAAGKPAPTEAPFVCASRFNLDPARQGEWLEWFVRNYLPRLCEYDDVYRGRLFEIDEEISNIMTAERQIYGGGPGQQRYLTIQEIAVPELASPEAWGEREVACGLKGWRRELIRDLYAEFSWLELALYAPGL